MAQNMLHPGARWLFRINAYFSLLIPIFFISIWASTFLLAKLTKITLGIDLLTNVILIIILMIIIIIIFGEIYARMAYNRWFYEFTHNGLRTERGIIWKKYNNVPYERIQNVDITRGILARILGFSTINIQTAGYSATYGRYPKMHSEGYIPAVSIEGADKIRDYVLGRVSKHHKSQGL